ncbi:MAG: hypothetical protein RLZZ86_3243 [Cyanobacteriota bacterium]|jgi:hypothetical protein
MKIHQLIFQGCALVILTALPSYATSGGNYNLRIAYSRPSSNLSESQNQ